MKGMLLGAMVLVGLMGSGVRAQERPIPQVGDSVRVSYASGNYFTGRVLSFTGDTLVIRDDWLATRGVSGERIIEVETVERLEVRGWKEPGRGQAGQVAGASVGLVTGFVVAGIYYCDKRGTNRRGIGPHYCDADPPPRGLRFRYELLALGAGLGWIIGWASSSVEPRWGWIEGDVQRPLTINPTFGNGIGFSASIRTN